MPVLSVKIPDKMHRDARTVVALRNETMADLLRQALAAYLIEVAEEADDVRRVDETEARRAAGKGHRVPME